MVASNWSTPGGERPIGIDEDILRRESFDVKRFARERDSGR
jgi:hypothetical protein